MKQTITILILFLSLNLFSQVKLVEKNETNLIGEIKTEYIPGEFYKAHLKEKKINGKTQYELMLSNQNTNRDAKFNTEPCVAGFFAESKDIELIYKTVAKDFSNPSDAKTTFKIGEKELKIGDGTFHRNINSGLYQTERNESELYINIDNCTIYITLSQWKKLFGK